MITAIDSTSNPNLIIIGGGKWGNKVFNILANEYPNVILIAARDFLNSPQVLARNESNTIFWICSRPDLQLSIVGQLVQLNVHKIIIEKPYFKTKSEFDSLAHIIRNSTRTKFFVSEPWLHSALWREGKEAIFKLNESFPRIRIKINRGSNDLRDFINPVQDWLPHDIGLIFDLAMTLGKSKVDFLGVPIIKRNLFRGKSIIGDKIEIDFAIGYIPEGRTALWIVESPNDSFIINFTNLSIQNQKDIKNISAKRFSADNPLVNQYEWIAQQKSDDFLLDKLSLHKKALILT